MRNNFSKFAFTANVVLAMAFTFGCSGDDDSSDGTSSPSGGSGPSSCVGGTITIGSQVWQKCNSNVETSVGISKCYDNNPANCAKYGRLYNLEAANYACPQGFHLPSNYEWDALLTEVGGFGTAGNKLKAKSGWSEGGNGTDEYGFAALPGGFGYSSGYFHTVGENGIWWSTPDGKMISDGFDFVADFGGNNDYLFSVRCLKDVDGGSGCVGGTVKIGNQVWQKCNSNVVPEKGVHKCCGNNPLSCTKFGRLYDWEAANYACPQGFHLPTKEDWDALTAYIEGDKGCDSCDAKHLKAKNGWIDNGLDSYGFSALPNDTKLDDGNSDPSCLLDYGDDVISNSGMWWSASEHYSLDASYCWYMYADIEYVMWGICGKSGLLTVRCLKDEDYGGSSSSSSSRPVSSSSSVGGGSDLGPCVGGTVTIGTQVWQKCNSDAVPSKGVYKCYDNSESNCQKYGKLYDWEAANSVCPSGFHLPTKEEWEALTAYIEDDNGCTKCDAKHLKATSGWNNNGNGKDTYGFSALPGGYGNSNGDFIRADNNGRWWSASENLSFAYYQYMDYNRDLAYWDYYDKYNLCSVRCIQD